MCFPIQHFANYYYTKYNTSIRSQLTPGWNLGEAAPFCPPKSAYVCDQSNHGKLFAQEDKITHEAPL